MEYESIKCTSRNAQLQRLAPRVACLAAAPNSSRRFGPANEVKERLHCQALRRTGRPSSDVAAGSGVFSRPALVGLGQDVLTAALPQDVA